MADWRIELTWEPSVELTNEALLALVGKADELHNWIVSRDPRGITVAQWVDGRARLSRHDSHIAVSEMVDWLYRERVPGVIVRVLAQSEAQYYGGYARQNDTS